MANRRELMKKKATRATSTKKQDPEKILVIDIGGSKIKILASGETEARKVASGKKLTPTRMIELVTGLAEGWSFDAVSVGYPGLVGPNGPRSEPGNLGPGWVGFDFASAFERPVRCINDAAMQALGSYEGGRMLFLGLGTGLGSTFIAENVIIPLELGQVPFREDQTLGALVSRAGLRRLGKTAWRSIVNEMVGAFTHAFLADYVVLGGGNAKVVKELPPGARRGHNLTAFRGGFRLWNIDDMPTLSTKNDPSVVRPAATEWRVI